jgi:hypothetical protein
VNENWNGKLQGALFNECGEWIWEQLQEEGFSLAGEVIDLILQTERELGVHTAALPVIADRLDGEFRERGISGNPHPIDAALIRVVLDWEDEFLGFAGISRAES